MGIILAFFLSYPVQLEFMPILQAKEEKSEPLFPRKKTGTC
jgi:hypothetical protein